MVVLVVDLLLFLPIDEVFYFRNYRNCRDERGDGWLVEGWIDVGWFDVGWIDVGWLDEGWLDEGWLDEG